MNYRDKRNAEKQRERSISKPALCLIAYKYEAISINGTIWSFFYQNTNLIRLQGSLGHHGPALCCGVVLWNGGTQPLDREKPSDWLPASLSECRQEPRCRPSPTLVCSRPFHRVHCDAYLFCSFDFFKSLSLSTHSNLLKIIIHA